MRAYAERMQPVGGRGHRWDGHVLLVYATEQERRAGVVAWVRRGLEAEAKIVYVEPADAPAERSLMQVLSDDHVDVTRAVGRGQLQVVDPRAGLGTAWQAALVEDGLDAGYPAVRLGGDAGTSWSVMSPLDHADAEWAADELCRTRPASILCQYSASVTPSMLERACAMHGAGVRESKLLTVPIQDGVAIAGEVDLSNVQILRSALAAACESTNDVVCAEFVVDLARLTFLDVAGARALVTGTRLYRSRGGVVLLRGAQPIVDRLLRQLGMDQVDGIFLEGQT